VTGLGHLAAQGVGVAALALRNVGGRVEGACSDRLRSSGRGGGGDAGELDRSLAGKRDAPHIDLSIGPYPRCTLAGRRQVSDAGVARIAVDAGDIAPVQRPCIGRRAIQRLGISVQQQLQPPGLDQALMVEVAHHIGVLLARAEEAGALGSDRQHAVGEIAEIVLRRGVTGAEAQAAVISCGDVRCAIGRAHDSRPVQAVCFHRLSLENAAHRRHHNEHRNRRRLQPHDSHRYWTNKCFEQEATFK